MFSWAYATRAASSRATASAPVSWANRWDTRAFTASRWASRDGLSRYRGSVASEGSPRKTVHSDAHSRSFWIATSTVAPSPAVKGP